MPRSETVLSPELNDTVVRELYEAAAGLVPWPTALDGLFAELKVRQMQLVTVDKTNGALVRSDQPAHMDSVVFDAILEYVREYHRYDPHLSYTGSMPVGVVVNTANVFPIEEYKHHRFYRDYWAAFDVRELLAAKVAEDERYVVMIGMSRTHDLPAYTPADMALLKRYVGHLAAAYRIVKHLGEATACKNFADPIFIGSMFDLTPAEARITVALLEGGNLHSIAAAQRVSLETIRSQLKSVFLKTHTSRQADLIALLMRITSH